MRIFFEYNGELLNKEQIEYIEKQFGVKAINVIGKGTIEQVDILNKYLDEIDDFLEAYNEETGLCGCPADYDTALSELVETLYYIKQHTK